MFFIEKMIAKIKVIYSSLSCYTYKLLTTHISAEMVDSGFCFKKCQQINEMHHVVIDISLYNEYNHLLSKIISLLTPINSYC